MDRYCSVFNKISTEKYMITKVMTTYVMWKMSLNLCISVVVKAESYETFEVLYG